MPHLEKVGYGVWLLAGAVFAVPEIWASSDSDLAIPTLSGTVGHLERRWEVISLPVILVVVNALLHAVRLGRAFLARRVEQRAAELMGGTIEDQTVQLGEHKHVAVDAGRVSRVSKPRQLLGWGFAGVYLVFTLVLVALGYVIPLWIHGWQITDAQKQLSGEFGYGAMAVAFFLIPTALAYKGLLVPFPGLFATVINLEQRIPVFAVLVAGCMTFLTLHLVLYPYPGIIPWFPDLEHLHYYCRHHAQQLICSTRK